MATLPELFGEIEHRFPAINKHLRDDSGQARRFVNIYVNEEDIRFLGGNEYRFREGDRVLGVPSIAGGCRRMRADESDATSWDLSGHPAWSLALTNSAADLSCNGNDNIHS